MQPNTAEDVAGHLAFDIATPMTSPPVRRWYYTQNGERFGPITGPELRAAAQLGFLGRRDHVRCGSDGRWFRAAAIAGLFGAKSM